MPKTTRQPRKTIDVIRLSWWEDDKYKVFYYHYQDAGVLFFTLARLIRKHIDFSLKARRESCED